MFIAGAREGSLRAQKKLFESYYAYVMSISLRYMATREEAEEVLNDVFLKVFAKIQSYDSQFPFKGWLRKIAINSSIDRLRAIRSIPFLTELTNLIQMPVEDEAYELDNDQNVLPLIQKLPPKYRAVFNLYVFEEYKHKEIAKLLGISEGTSKSNYSRAKNILKKSLQRKQEGTRQQDKHLVFKGDAL